MTDTPTDKYTLAGIIVAGIAILCLSIYLFVRWIKKRRHDKLNVEARQNLTDTDTDTGTDTEMSFNAVNEDDLDIAEPNAEDQSG